MATKGTKFINFREVEMMIDEEIDVLEGIQYSGTNWVPIASVIKLLKQLKFDLNEEWHEEIEEWFT